MASPRAFPLLFILLTVCAGEPQPVPKQAVSIVADVVLAVHNHTGRRIDIAVESDSLVYMLGPVAAGASQSFSLPSGLSDSVVALHLTATPKRGVPIRTEQFRIGRGEKREWTVEEQGSVAVFKP